MGGHQNVLDNPLHRVGAVFDNRLMIDDLTKPINALEDVKRDFRHDRVEGIEADWHKTSLSGHGSRISL